MARGYRKAAQFRLSGARKTGKIRVRDIAEFRVEIGIGIVFHEGRRGVHLPRLDRNWKSTAQSSRRNLGLSARSNAQHLRFCCGRRSPSPF
jgi:hypothetical protein